MVGLSSLGIGSGLDLNSLVTKLMDAEKVPLTALDKKEADYQAKLTAYGTLKSAFSSFQTSAKSLSSSTRFGTTKATAADTTQLSATTSSIAKPATYSIEIDKLAQAHKLASAQFTEPASAVGTGTLTIDFGTYDSGGNTFTVNAARTAKSVVINGSNNSLAGIRDAINEAGAGVTASILNDGGGYRLVVSGNDTGAANSVRVRVAGDGDANNTDAGGLSQLAYDPTATPGNGTNLEEKLAAQDAEFSIDGLPVKKSSNAIGDAIGGVTLRLLKADPGNPTTLTVARDPAEVKTAVEGFVAAYNELNTTIKGLGGFDIKKQTGGLLVGDATLRGVESQVRNLLSQRVDGASSGVASLSDIGVTFQRDGSLAINSGKLDDTLADASKNVAGLFAVIGAPTDSLVKYAGSSSTTRTGEYGLFVSQIATRGQVVGGTALAASTVITTGVNDTLALSLDGINASVTLNAGTYTRDQLVAEVQARINSASGLASLNYTLTASHAAGIVTLTSARYGASSNVVVSGGSAVATLFGTTTSTAGVDVAGEIGGVAATGKGQTLTGTGNAIGLQVLVEGGNTGTRGTVSFSRGLAWQLDRTITGLLGEDGAIASRTEGIDRSIEDIGDRRVVLNRRLEAIEKRYRAQFVALDSLIASMQQTSEYLTQQLANLPATSGNNAN